MIEHELWRDSIYEFNFENVDTENLINEYLDLRSKSNGIVKSNQGGWQEDIARNQYPHYEHLIQNIEMAANDLFYNHFLYDFEIRICNAWLNVNEKGHSNANHTHPGATYSGVFYVTSNNTGDIGVINFQRSNAHEVACTILDMPQQHSQWKYQRQFLPIQNRLYLFPPYLSHSVEPNSTDDTRIILAFNFMKCNHMKDYRQRSICEFV